MFPDEDSWEYPLFMPEYISISEGNMKKITYIAEGILKIVFKYLSWAEN